MRHRRLRRFLVITAVLYAGGAVLVPYLKRPPGWEALIAMNFAVLTFVGISMTAELQRDQVVRDALRRLDLLQLSQRQIDHDLRNVLGLVALSQSELSTDDPAVRRLRRVLGLVDALEVRAIPVRELVDGIAVEPGTGALERLIEDRFSVYANRATLDNLLDNLVRNAFEAGAARVTVRAVQRQVRIQDDGPGFDPQALRSGRSQKAHGAGRTLTDVLPELGRIYQIDYTLQSDTDGTRVTLDFTRNQALAEVLEALDHEGGDHAQQPDPDTAAFATPAAAPDRG